MATRISVHQDQPRGGVKQKNMQGERRKRTALGDIGNLVTGPKVQAKPQIQINRPITRSFGAQLLANAQAASDKNKKQCEQVVDLGMVPNNKPRILKAMPVASNPAAIAATFTNSIIGEEKEKKKCGPSFTSVLSARSKEACGLPKPKNLVVNIDENDTENELAVFEYVEEIYQFHRLTEGESRVSDYMSAQQDINERMRSILVDWLIEVHYKFELRPETLYLTINIIDRFLSVKSVPRKELQLVGMGALLIASKYEEIWATEVNDLVCISDRAYTREQVCAMEKSILGKLEWLLTVPTPYMFLPRFIKASIPSGYSEMENMVSFFAELGIMNYNVTVSYSPSMLAASSVYAARCTLNMCPSWTETLQHYTGYSEDQIKVCAKLLVNLHSMAPESKLRAVYKKFSKSDFDSVALKSPAKNLLA
ncbi:hypothetical protein V2J09_005364 [Rumex salicifolius]